MRKGWREAWGVIGVVGLFIGVATAAGPRPGRADGGTAIRLTLDVTWGDPALPALPPGAAAVDAAVDLEVGEGRVLEARAPGEAPVVPRVRSDGFARLGTGPSGRVRVRIETTAGATLRARVGGIVVPFAVAGIFDAPMRTNPAGGVPIRIERVAWDAIEVRLGPEGVSDGIFAPGAAIATTLNFNILLPEPSDVSVRYWAELRPARGGDPVWTLTPRRELMPANATRPPGVLLSIPAPKAEGSYVLEVHATWEPPAGTEGSRIARLFKKRRGGSPVEVVRRTSLAVVATGGPPPIAAPGIESISDSLDLTRARSQRAMASGRGPAPGGPGAAWTLPEAALVEASRRDRLRGWNPFGGGEGAILPAADAKGLAWSAMALRVNRPGRPHRLTVKVAEGRPSDLGVALVATGGSFAKPRLLLDASGSGPALGDGSTPLSVAWPVWPDSEELVLVVVNRSEGAAIKVAAIELRELAVDPAPADLAETHPDAPRPLALHLADPRALDRFGGFVEDGPPDVWGLALNLSSYALHCGASSLVLADGPPDRARRVALEGQSDEDSTGPDHLDLILRVLARKKLSALLEVRFDGPLPGLPPSDSAEALTRGLVRVDRAGKADGPTYQPLRAEVREAMTAALAAAIKPRAAHPNLLGLVVRLGPGATLPGSPGAGLDDVTYPQFVRSAFQPEAMAKVPGLNESDPKRFAARWQFVTGPGREDWLDWRSERIGNLYGELAAAVKGASPGAVLVVSTPGLDDGPAGVEARRADRALLSPLQAWRAIGLDLAKWPVGPVVLRGVGHSTDDLAHDLATSADLDAAVASRPGRGMWLGADEIATTAAGPLRMMARPVADGPSGDEPLGHALAVLDARWVIVSGMATQGQENRLAKFARVYRALPGPPDSAPPVPRMDSGVAVRSWGSAGRTYVAMANDTPYVILLDTLLHAPPEATVDDLGRRQRLIPAAAANGARSLVLELPPFGVAVLRVSSASARVEPIGPYLPAGNDLDTRREHLSVLLDRMAQGDGSPGPRNGGFEESTRPRVVAVTDVRPPRASATNSAKPLGWAIDGEAAGAVELDAKDPRSGRSALRLDARAAGASAASTPFLPPGRSTLVARAWVRADRVATPVRLWVEGEGAGKPFARHVEVVAGPEWSEVRLVASDLPDGGLDRVRVRIERRAAGPLWIDDVSVSGDGPSEVAKRSQLVLTAALHAYREKRYADFARLAGSRWARQAEPDAEPTPIRSAGGPTDLPSGRRLR